MSASKKQQYILYKQDQLGDVDRLKSICFPKTPKTTSSNIQNNGLSNSGGKFNSSQLNPLQKQSNQVQFYGDGSPPTSTQKRKTMNRSLDYASGSFGKENNSNIEENSIYAFQNSQNLENQNSRSRQTLKSISQNQYIAAQNDNYEDQDYPRKRSEKKQSLFNYENNQNFTNQNQKSRVEQNVDYFKLPNNISQIRQGNKQDLLKYTPQIKTKTAIDTPINSSNIMCQMATFIRNVGCELNDLCLTKMSEKTLQSQIEKHLSEVSKMQNIFKESLKEKEPNIAYALNVLSKCFEELVEKLGDLITRLRMFNKRKFKNLVEQSLTSTLKEIFEENNKLNVLEIITDINNLYSWRLSQIIQSHLYKNKFSSFYQIMNIARHSKLQLELKEEKINLKLTKAFLIPQNIWKQRIKIAFYKWHYCKQFQKSIEGKQIEGISRLDIIMKNFQRQSIQRGFIAILQSSKEQYYKLVKFKEFIQLLLGKIMKNKQNGFEVMKKNLFVRQMNKNSSIQQIKTQFAVKVLKKIINRKQQDLFKQIEQHIRRKEKYQIGLNQLFNVFLVRKQTIAAKFFCNISHISKQQIQTQKFRGVILSKLIERVFHTRIQEIFNIIKTELFVRPQPIKLVFKAVHDAVEKIENPTLRNILRTIDVCFSNKKITRHLTNLRQISYVAINMHHKEYTQLNAIWKKLEHVQLQNEQTYYINQLVNKENSFENGVEMLNYPILSVNIQARENKCVQTFVFPLNFESNSNSYLVCETACNSKMNDQMVSKIIKLSGFIRIKLKESFFRERLQLNNCRNIRERHLKKNISKYYSTWKQSIYERLITEKDQTTEKAHDLEKQLLQYKVDLEKNKVHSLNIQKELGMKREEIIEIETRLEDLTIEKKAKSKCLATALFANYIEKRETKLQSAKRCFVKWVDFMLQKRIATVACQQIEEINTKHYETRFQSAFYLLKHFQDSYQRRLKVYTLKYLAYNSVCNNSQLNFSQFNNNINRSSTPTTLSPNIHMSKKKYLNQNLSQNSLIAGVNILDTSKYNNYQPSLTEMSQNNGQSESNLNIHIQRQSQIQGQNCNFETPITSPMNSNLYQSILQDTKQKPFFSSAGGNNQNNSQVNKSNSKNPNSSILQQSNQQQQLNQSIGFNREANQQYQQQNMFMKKNDSSQNMQILTEDSTSQPPIQLQPTQITNPLMSTTSRAGINNNSSTSSLVNLNIQPPQHQSGQQYSLTSQKFNPRNQQQNENQQGKSDNIFIQQQSSDTRRSNNNLNNSFNNFYRPPILNQDYLDTSSQNINTQSSNTYRGTGLNKSYSGQNSLNQSQQNNNSTNPKQPSNLGYRLSAKTVNFLQKFGRGSSTGDNSASLYGNTPSSSSSRIMSNSQIRNSNCHQRYKSSNNDH